MKKYILLVSLFFMPLLGFSSDTVINETKSDVYFANGVLTDEDSAEANLELIRTKVRLEQYDNSILKIEKELNFKKAYNQTFGTVGDFYEALMQKADESFGWEALYNTTKATLALAKDQEIEVTLPNGEVVNIPAPLFDQFVQITHEADLTTQVTSYRESIRQGHGVVVLAHSQGNLFTNEAYQKMISDDDARDNIWLKEYFTRISIASPSDIKNGGDLHIIFHNDPITELSSLAPTTNPNKAYERNALGEIIDYDANSEDYHSFRYYMGEKADVYSNEHGRVSTDVAKIIIMDFVKNAIDSHREKQSQWATNEESDENTKDYRITVKHIYDENIIMDANVYPFAANKKLYQVKDTAGVLHYVKASFGGERILNDSEWEAEDNQFYKLEGTDPVEYIEAEDTCRDPLIFEVVSHENIRTENWRVTVKNKNTGEVQTGVYPFNLNGSLYQIESGDFVLASCGGIEVLSNWQGKVYPEDYKLKGTDEIISSHKVMYAVAFISTTENECGWDGCPNDVIDSSNDYNYHFIGYHFWVRDYLSSEYTGIGEENLVSQIAEHYKDDDFEYNCNTFINKTYPLLKSKVADGAKVAKASLTGAIFSIYNNAKILYSYTKSTGGLTNCDLSSEGLDLKVYIYFTLE